ncbi:MAG: tetraacyldisaccharide 4'-kinase [Verrucomicrobiota bacterium]|nr:tetraacyldisaccharide 4'-kinase [Verrucomicrobiota bacterium]
MKANRFERFERYMVPLLSRDTERKMKLPVRLLLGVLLQVSRVYRVVVQLRLFLYEKGIFRHHTLGCQVISVGNLTVGGTGKTPVVEVFARELQREGRKVAILSRGYRKQEPPFARRLADAILLREWRQPPRVVSDGAKLLLDCEMSGDEPYMLAANLPDVAVLVDKNRVKSGRYAINRLQCDTLILDDGFQYLALKHRVKIVLVDKTNPFGNERVLPRGLLREPVKNIRRADVVFLTKSDGRDSETLKSRIRALNSRAEVVECKHCPRHFRNVYGEDCRDLTFVAGKAVTVVSGIAAPLGFERELERMGARILERNRFADHHRYAEQEIIDIINRSRKLGADAIVTTQKDAVRFPKLARCDVPIYFLKVEIDILSGAESFQQCIARICFRT